MESILGYLKPLVEAYAGNYSVAIQIVSIIGTLRLLVKPLMTILEVVVKLTPSKADDALPEKVKNHKVYKAIAYGLDWFASIKLKK